MVGYECGCAVAGGMAGGVAGGVADEMTDGLFGTWDDGLELFCLCCECFGFSLGRGF